MNIGDLLMQVGGWSRVSFFEKGNIDGFRILVLFRNYYKLMLKLRK